MTGVISFGPNRANRLVLIRKKQRYFRCEKKIHSSVLCVIYTLLRARRCVRVKYEALDLCHLAGTNQEWDTCTSFGDSCIVPVDLYYKYKDTIYSKEVRCGLWWRGLLDGWKGPQSWSNLLIRWLMTKRCWGQSVLWMWWYNCYYEKFVVVVKQCWGEGYGSVTYSWGWEGRLVRCGRTGKSEWRWSAVRSSGWVNGTRL
jgi:hypothetical protein